MTGASVATQSVAGSGDSLTPLEARAVLIRLVRARASRAEIERAADDYREAIRRRAQATGRRLPVPSRAGIIRLLT